MIFAVPSSFRAMISIRPSAGLEVPLADTHEELEECLDELRAQRDSLECDEPDDLDSEAYEEWEEQCEQLDEKIEEIEDLLEG